MQPMSYRQSDVLVTFEVPFLIRLGVPLVGNPTFMISWLSAVVEYKSVGIGPLSLQ